MLRHASPLVAARSGISSLRRELSTWRPPHAAPTSPSSSTSHSTAAPWVRKTADERTSRSPGSDRDPSLPHQRVRYATRERTTPTQPHLRPAVLSQRLTALANGGLLDDAVELLKNAPTDAQNVVTWNNLLTLVMKAGRYKLGYSLYIDMKRRGFVPNAATYGTLMKGYSLIPEELWPKYTLQLENVHKLYDNFLAYIETAKDDKSSTPSDRVHYSVPVFHYFTVLRKAGLYERLFEVYNLLEAEGSELLTPQVYSSMFAHLSHRKALPSGMEGDVRHKSASDARLIWRQMLRTFAKTGYEADAILITHLIFCLSRGRPADQLFAFDIVRDYLGLVPPGEPAVQSKIPMHPYAFVSVLELCMASKKYALCIHYTLQMMEREPEMVDARTCEVALRALASRSSMGTMAEASQALEIVEFLLREAALSKHRSAQLWPTPSIYRAALAVCWRGGDWVTATRLFELITRIDADSFLDGQTPAKPPSARPGAAMDVSNMSLLVRTALASGVPAHMRQCLRMVDHIQLLDELQPDAIASSNTKGLKLSLAEYNYYRGQYAFRLVSLINAVFKHNALVTEGKVEAGEDQYVIPEGEQRRWLSIRTEVTGYMEARPGWKLPTSVPFIERSQLGSAGQIAKAEESVDNEMTNRHIKSAPAAS